MRREDEIKIQREGGVKRSAKIKFEEQGRVKQSPISTVPCSPFCWLFRCEVVFV